MSTKCWRGEDPRLKGPVPPAECGMPCAGSSKGEKCGDYDRMSVYKMMRGGSPPEEPGYVGCYADSKSRRAMPKDKIESKSMTNKVKVKGCCDGELPSS